MKEQPNKSINHIVDSYKGVEHHLKLPAGFKSSPLNLIQQACLDLTDMVKAQEIKSNLKFCEMQLEINQLKEKVKDLITAGYNRKRDKDLGEG